MIDKETERRVWQRIYGKPLAQSPGYSREKLQQCLRREQMNFRYYDNHRMDAQYGMAFDRMANDAAEHIKMLRQILGR